MTNAAATPTATAVVASVAATAANLLAPTDPRTHFAAAVRIASDMIEGVRPDQFESPTPCDEMTVRQLIQHLVEVLRRVEACGLGSDVWALGSFDVPNEKLLGLWTESAHNVGAAWADDAVLERIIVLPWSQKAGGDTLNGYTSELSVHTWDLAKATGQRPVWDDAAIAAGFAEIRTNLPLEGRAALFAAIRAQGREGMTDPFAEAVEVPADAPLIDQLVAFNGRRP